MKLFVFCQTVILRYNTHSSSLSALTLKETKMSQTKTPIQIDAKDLPLRCQGAQTQGWNGHPSVGLAIQANGTATCPYCGTVYQVNGKIQSHH